MSAARPPEGAHTAAAAAAAAAAEGTPAIVARSPEGARHRSAKHGGCQ
ncbi:hypothetical protein [Verminephrobacter eiseniae]|nr:hypothetical protein [Verminephrobacter eiseniae]